jgi:hypothetical protein
MVATKTHPHVLDKHKALEILNGFLLQFQQCCNKKHPPNASNFENFLSHNFQNSSNGKVIGKNVHDFLERIQKVQKRYSELKITPLHDCLISDNKVIAQYDVNLISLRGEKVQMFLMAIATIEDHLITQWSQVSHNKGIDHLES